MKVQRAFLLILTFFFFFESCNTDPKKNEEQESKVDSFEETVNNNAPNTIEVYDRLPEMEFNTVVDYFNHFSLRKSHFSEIPFLLKENGAKEWMISENFPKSEGEKARPATGNSETEFIVDLQNGFLEIKIPGGEGTFLIQGAIFADKNNGKIFAVSLNSLTPSDPFCEWYFCKLGKGLEDVSNEILPAISMDLLFKDSPNLDLIQKERIVVPRMILPQVGTDLKIVPCVDQYKTCNGISFDNAGYSQNEKDLICRCIELLKPEGFKLRWLLEDGKFDFE
ncbi:MAG: hypothetical protein H6581_30415 [Bacteroidia bacterium]|nr:hypothetical protein [Bacteroidia bacterium]